MTHSVRQGQPMGGVDSTIIQLLPTNVSAKRSITKTPIVIIHAANVEEVSLHHWDISAKSGETHAHTEGLKGNHPGVKAMQSARFRSC